MTQDDFRQMLESMADWWKASEYEMVIECFADQLLYSDALHYSFSNKKDLLSFFREDKDVDEDCVFHRSVFDERGQIGAVEYTYSSTKQYHGTVWVKLVQDRIVDWREYQHISDKKWEEFWKK